MRDVVIDVCAEEREDLPEDGDAGDSVNVVVAVEGDFLFLGEGLFDSLCGGFDAGEQFGADEVGQFGSEKGGAGLRVGDAAVYEQLRQKRRDLERFCELGGSRVGRSDDPGFVGGVCRRVFAQLRDIGAADEFFCVRAEVRIENQS